MADATLPTVIFASLVMFLGVIGNSVVCYICHCRLRRSVLNNFVLSLAALDLIGCVLCVPMEVTELQNRIRWSEPALCMTQRFLRNLLLIASVLILVAIATERYRRICHPLSRHITLRQCRIAIVVALVVAVLLSWPSLLVFGERTRHSRGWVNAGGEMVSNGGEMVHGGGETVNGGGKMVNSGGDRSEEINADVRNSASVYDADRVNGTQGVTDDKEGDTGGEKFSHSGSDGEEVKMLAVLRSGCGVKDSMQGTPYPAVYFSLLFVLFFVSSAIVCALYARIAFALWSPRKLQTDSRPKSVSLPDCSRLNTAVFTATRSATLGRGKKRRADVSGGDVTGNDVVRNDLTLPLPRKKLLYEELTRSLQLRRKRDAVNLLVVPTPSIRRKKRAAYSRKRTTFIMFLMTLTSVVSYLPFILVSIAYVASARMREDSSVAEMAVIELCLKSFLISSAVNPFIYGLCNQQFKKECVKLLQGLKCRAREFRLEADDTSDTPPNT
ncbi:uncharacterized protein [Littorina saxatilis]|uniref:G-protein coupled receptors family 1 profile domain-containing protein n=1 Tax=Littorina saxatilis TaxID=31220 RepID=A0AAN9AS03_9CAEN